METKSHEECTANPIHGPDFTCASLDNEAVEVTLTRNIKVIIAQSSGVQVFLPATRYWRRLFFSVLALRLL